MKKKLIIAVVGVLLIALFGLVLWGWLSAPPALATSTTLSILSGEEVFVNGVKAKDGMILKEKDKVETGADSRALITYFDGSTTAIEPNGEVVIGKMSSIRGVVTIGLKQNLGKTWSRVERFIDPASQYTIETPTGTMVARGTLIDVEVREEIIEGKPTLMVVVNVFEGKVEVIAQEVTKVVEAGLGTTVVMGTPPEEPKAIPLPLNRLEFYTTGPVWMLVVDPAGRSAGIIKPGLVVNQISRTTLSSPLAETQFVVIPDPLNGEYTIALYGRDKGTFDLTVKGIAKGEELFELDKKGVAIEFEQMGEFKLKVAVEDGILVSGELGDFKTIEAMPGKVEVKGEAEKKAVERVITAEAPRANFTYQVIKEGKLIHFLNLSSGDITEYSWSFGDGKTSMDINPTHDYTGMGEGKHTITVSLTTTGPGGTATKSLEIPIYIYPPLTADFAVVKTEALTDQGIPFTSTVSGGKPPYSYQWSFGDGETSTDVNPTHSYIGTRSYTVSLTVTDALGDAVTQNKLVYATIYPPLVADFKAEPPKPLIEQGITFAPNVAGGKPPYTYAWDFGDGKTSFDASPIHSYATATTYTVSFTVTDALGNRGKTSKRITIEEIVIFLDSQLEVAIRDHIGKPEGPIYKSDLVGMTFLVAPEKGISKLSGLENCTDLVKLELRGNQISDISPISGLTNLTYLSLSDNGISHISPISGLTNLTHLYLNNNQIEDIAALLGLANLTHLELVWNPLSEASLNYISILKGRGVEVFY